MNCTSLYEFFFSFYHYVILLSSLDIVREYCHVMHDTYFCFYICCLTCMSVCELCEKWLLYNYYMKSIVLVLIVFNVICLFHLGE